MRDAPVIYAIALTADGLKILEAGRAFTFTAGYTDNGSDEVIKDNLNHLLLLLKGTDDDGGEEYPFCRTNAKEGELISGFFNGYPDPEVQQKLTEFKGWFIGILYDWISDHRCSLLHTRDQDENYFLMIDCSI